MTSSARGKEFVNKGEKSNIRTNENFAAVRSSPDRDCWQSYTGLSHLTAIATHCLMDIPCKYSCHRNLD